jgi:hypothetical protein
MTMKSILAASVLALMSSTMALADDLDADINQVALGVQEALNNITDVKSATDVGQTAVSAANLVSKVDASNLDTVTQFSWLEQDAENSLDSGGTGFWWWYTPDYAIIKDVTQSATNVTNSISLGETVDDVTSGNASVLDRMTQTAFVDQWAINEIDAADTVEDVSQTAVNAANLISSEVETPDLEEVSQFAVGDQDAVNSIVFKTSIDGNATDDLGDLVPSTQDATNVINSVSVKSVNTTLAQFSDVDQKASNVADSVGNNSNVWDFEQTAVNATNLVSVDAITVGLGINQLAFVSQEASNLIDANGSVEAVVQSATNVANSIGD